MNIDFIKWMCEKGAGFGFDEYCHRKTINYPMGDWEWIDNLHQERFQLVYYPLLLQRACESIETEEKYMIESETVNGLWSYEVRSWAEDGLLFGTALIPIDKAKESALKYIWEQEQV